MFDITPDDIKNLNDADLRTLVGRLCVWEMRARELPISSVTYGGDQDAPDGGLDVRVELSSTVQIEGFVPRPATGFQVKKQKMPRAKILAEMRPSGVLRETIKELADQSGAYIIVSSEDSTADSTALRRRRQAMAEAVNDLASTCALKLDFYDRTRLATWVGAHESLIPWVREKVGRPIAGWHSYGNWAYSSEGEGGKYLLDEKLRVQTGKKESPGGLQALEGIKQMRDLLRQPGKVARLVGLSGVGKTRLLQALFDERVGEHSLDSSHAFYTNMAEGPEPQPTILASRLIASRTKAILVIDNCSRDLHRRLSELCRSQGSPVSVITVEFDIQDDEPEGTEVFRLETASLELIEKLIRRRYPEVSAIDAQTIAKFSDGNARVAIALAETIDERESLAGLRDQDLFERLFWQRHQPDSALLRAAEACSLVYSFQGDDVPGGDLSELTDLGALVGKNAREMYFYVAELQRRGLVQQRSVWRAVLPHAIANRLAAGALQNIPSSLIEAQILRGSERIRKSFSRRLGYLDSIKKARDIVTQWLAPGGLLADVLALDDLGWAMFENVAPAVPDVVLSTLERASQDPLCDQAWHRHTEYVYLLRSLAYDAPLFERCVALILNDGSNRAREVFVSLFQLYLSGTHATVEQRLGFIEPLLFSENAQKRKFGLAALESALEAWQFDSAYNFDFGARSRDFGYWPRTKEEVGHWFGLGLKLCEKIACSDGPSAPQVRAAVAESFRGIWTRAGVHTGLEEVCRAIAGKGFWPEGWHAIRQTIRRDSKSFTADIAGRLVELEKCLRPRTLAQEVRSILSPKDYSHLYLVDSDQTDPTDISSRKRLAETRAHDLGKAVAADDQTLLELLAELVSGEVRVLMWSFGHGFAEGALHPNEAWNRLTVQLKATAEDHRNVQILQGFLSALSAVSPGLANTILDDAVQDPTLAAWYPVLQASLAIEKQGVGRLMRSLALGKAPIGVYRSLVYGRATDPIAGKELRELLLEIASKPEGLDVAIEILQMRLWSDDEQKIDHTPEIIDAGRELLRRLRFTKKQYQYQENYRPGEVARSCLVGDGGSAIVLQICDRLKDSISKCETDAHEHQYLVGGMFSAQPVPTLDGLCAGDADGLNVGFRIIVDLRPCPLDVMPELALFGWCDQEPKVRYPAVASVITSSQRPYETAPLEWTQTALRLLEKAPDRVEVLRQLLGKLARSDWSGSEATAIETHVKLLQELEGHHDPAVLEFITHEKARLAEAIEAKRRFETLTDRARDERFE